MARSRKGKKTTFVGKDLELFSEMENNFFVFNVEKNKGIQCRFGMRGKCEECCKRRRGGLKDVVM